jgi:hypothetical protein
MHPALSSSFRPPNSRCRSDQSGPVVYPQSHSLLRYHQEGKQLPKAKQRYITETPKNRRKKDKTNSTTKTMLCFSGKPQNAACTPADWNPAKSVKPASLQNTRLCPKPTPHSSQDKAPIPISIPVLIPDVTSQRPDNASPCACIKKKKEGDEKKEKRKRKLCTECIHRTYDRPSPPSSPLYFSV